MTMENGMQVTKAAYDKHNLMKQELLEEFQLKYTQLVRFVASMPLNHAMRMNGFGRCMRERLCCTGSSDGTS